MRMRYKPYARPELAAWPHHIDSPSTLTENLDDYYADPNRPFRLELGCGKGGFLAERALAEPDYNYLGIDIKSEVLVVAKRTIERLFSESGIPIANIAIAPYNIEKIAEILAGKLSIERIYVNFCNPWTKKGHAKHRLTHPRQLAQYRHFLKNEGEIHFKTDNAELFEDSLRYFKMTGFRLLWVTRDLHAEEPAWNIRTEHEKMFSEQGIPIKACIAQIIPAQLDYEAIMRSREL